MKEGSVLEGRVQVRGGVTAARTRSPPRSGREGRLLSSRPSYKSRSTAALDGSSRPGIPERRPYRGCGHRPDAGSGSSRLRRNTDPSTAPLMDQRGHQSACNGRDRYPEERRNRHITAAVMRLHHFRCVPHHHAAQTWLLQRPSSLTHPTPSGAW